MKLWMLALVMLLGGAQERAFEVLSIRPATRDLLPPGTDEEDSCSGAALRPAGRQLTSAGATLHSLIAL